MTNCHKFYELICINKTKLKESILENYIFWYRFSEEKFYYINTHTDTSNFQIYDV